MIEDNAAPAVQPKLADMLLLGDPPLWSFQGERKEEECSSKLCYKRTKTVIEEQQL